MGKVATENTLQKGVDLLGIIARNQIREFNDYATIQKIVRNGDAENVFNIGDQIIETWNNGTTDLELPFDIVHIGTAINADGDIVPALYLQAHWALPGVQFDGNEAFYYCDEGLAAGTYNVTMGNNWGTNVVANKVYQFTLTEAVPAGGQLVFTTASSTTGALPDQAPANWRVRSYASQTSTTHLEIVEVTEGNDGTSLGTLSSSTKFGTTGLNNMQRASYGYNRWSQSGIRQWLNSAAAVGEWWTPKNVYDRPPEQLTTMRGFMAGLDEGFLSVLQPVRVTTALNTVSDSEIGASEITTDLFSLPSLEQEYVVPQASGVEGEAWDYWRQRLGGTSPQGTGSDHANANHIRYAIENHTSSQHVRLRSAIRGYASGAWYVTTSGYVNYYSAASAFRPCPACVIC